MEKRWIILAMVIILLTITVQATNTTEFNDYMRNYNDWKGGNNKIEEVKTVDQIMDERQQLAYLDNVTIEQVVQQQFNGVSNMVFWVITITMGLIIWHAVFKNFWRGLY